MVWWQCLPQTGFIEEKKGIYECEQREQMKIPFLFLVH